MLNLKRGREDNIEQCIICQNDKHEKLLNASEQGLARLKESASVRHKLRDTKKQGCHGPNCFYTGGYIPGVA